MHGLREHIAASTQNSPLTATYVMCWQLTEILDRGDKLYAALEELAGSVAAIDTVAPDWEALSGPFAHAIAALEKHAPADAAKPD